MSQQSSNQYAYDQELYEQHIKQLDKIKNEIEAQDPFIITQPIELQILESEYLENQGFLQKIQKIRESYPFFRRVRRDGSCFYRAVLFRIFEQIIESKDQQLLTKFSAIITNSKTDLTAVGYEQIVIDDFYDEITKQIKLCPNNITVQGIVDAFCNKVTSDYLIMQCWNKKLISQFHNFIPYIIITKILFSIMNFFHYYFILFCQIVYKHYFCFSTLATKQISFLGTFYFKIFLMEQKIICINQHNLLFTLLFCNLRNDIIFNTQVNTQIICFIIQQYMRMLTSGYIKANSFLFEGYIETGTVELFCQQEVDPIDREADQMQIIALQNYLQIPIRIFYLDGNVATFDATVFQIPEDANPNSIFINLLYRPGHYDILYPK